MVTKTFFKNALYMCVCACNKFKMKNVTGNFFVTFE